MDRDEIKVHVDRRGHANLDSLPLRYGFYSTEDRVLELQNCCNWEKKVTQKKDGSFEKRYHVDADFKKPNGEIANGHFLIADHGYEYFNCITVWKNDFQTEQDLSKHLRKAREEGTLTPQYLVELHPYYQSGQAASVAGLIGVVAKIEKDKTSRAHEKLETVQETAAKATQFARRQMEEKHKIEDALEAERSRANDAEASSKEELERRKALELDIERLQKKIISFSKNHPQYDGSEVALSTVGKLLGVTKRKRTKSNGQTVECVFLEFEGNLPERKMDEIFDPGDVIFNKATELIGEMVVTVTWKPEIFKATYWFRDIFPWNADVQPKTNLNNYQIENSPTQSKFYLNCPFHEKDECKALGGKWDPERKKWYVPEGLNKENFQKWLPV